MAVKPIDNLNKRLQKNSSAATSGMATTSQSESRATMASDGTPKLPRGLGGVMERDTDISNIAADMMSQDNRLMRRARTEGLQTANRRGLLNSSMAVGASQDAVLDRIVPMASQEAGQRHERAMSGQTSLQRQQEAEQTFGFTSRISKQEFDQTMEQLGSEQAFAQAESQADRAHAAEMLAKELHSDMDLANLDAQTRENLIRIEGEFEERIASLDIALSDRELVMDTFVSVQGQYQDALRTIMNNPDVAAADRNSFINSMQGMLDAQITAIEGLAGIEIDFSTGELGGPFEERGSRAGSAGGIETPRRDRSADRA